MADWSERDVVAAADWSRCDLVERAPGKLSGAWLVKGTRLPVWAILNHADEYAPEEIVAEIFPDVTVDVVRRIIDFARTDLVGRRRRRSGDIDCFELAGDGPDTTRSQPPPGRS